MYKFWGIYVRPPRLLKSFGNSPVLVLERKGSTSWFYLLSVMDYVMSSMCFAPRNAQCLLQKAVTGQVANVHSACIRLSDAGNL